MDEAEFQRQAENIGDTLTMVVDRVRVMNRECADVRETRHYLSLARNAAEESELWLGKAMVAYASNARHNSPQG